jgi:hypothetical protein
VFREPGPSSILEADVYDDSEDAEDGEDEVSETAEGWDDLLLQDEDDLEMDSEMDTASE